MVPTMENIEKQVKEYGIDAINWKLVAGYTPCISLEFIEKYKGRHNGYLNIKDIFRSFDSYQEYPVKRVEDEVIRKYVEEGGDLKYIYSYRGPIPSDVVDKLIDYYFDSIANTDVDSIEYFESIFRIIRNDQNVDHLIERFNSLPYKGAVMDYLEIYNDEDKRDYLVSHLGSPWMRLSDEKIVSILFDDFVDDFTINGFITDNSSILTKNLVIKILQCAKRIKTIEDTIEIITKEERFDSKFFMDLMVEIEKQFPYDDDIVEDIKTTVVEDLLMNKDDVSKEFYDKYIYHVLSKRKRVIMNECDVTGDVIRNIRKYDKGIFMDNLKSFNFDPVSVAHSFINCPEDSEILEEVIRFYIDTLKSNKTIDEYDRGNIANAVSTIFIKKYNHGLSKQFIEYVASYMNTQYEPYYHDMPLSKQVIREYATNHPNASFEMAINNQNTDTDLYIDCLRNNESMIKLFKINPDDTASPLEKHGRLLDKIYLSLRGLDLDRDRLIQFFIYFVDEVNQDVDESERKILKRLIVSLLITSSILKVETMEELIEENLVSWFVAMVFYPDFEKISDKFSKKFSKFIEILYKKTINFSRDVAIINPCRDGVEWFERRFGELDKEVPYSEVIKAIIEDDKLSYLTWYYNSMYTLAGFENASEFFTDFNIKKTRKLVKMSNCDKKYFHFAWYSTKCKYFICEYDSDEFDDE